jgi:phosphate transport system substrate-binding protein
MPVRRGSRRVGIVLVACLTLGFAFGIRAAPNHASAQLPGEIELPAYIPAETVAGAVTIAGSDSMRPILTKLALEFRRWHPRAKIAIQGEEGDLLQRFLSGISFARRGDGDTDGHLGSQLVRVLAVSRELTKDETGAFVERFGYKPSGFPIAQDAVAVYVHRDNPLKGLTLDQVDAIFSDARKRGLSDVVERWGQVGADKGWENAPLHLYGRDKHSTGTRPFFMEHVLLGGGFRGDIQEEPGSASVVVSISRDRFGIGYSSIGFQTGAVRALPLAQKEGMPYVEPAQESVMRGNYPLSRRLYLYVNRAPNEPFPPVILEFLKFINSRRGQAMVAATGSYPISGAQASRNLQNLIAPPAGAPRTAGKP